MASRLEAKRSTGPTSSGMRRRVAELAEFLQMEESRVLELTQNPDLFDRVRATTESDAWSLEVLRDLLRVPNGALSEASGSRRLPDVIDLFAGSGGFSLGFQLTGFRVLAGFDSWSCAVDSYSENLGHRANLLDLSDVDRSRDALQPHFETSAERPAIIGGPPCQDFSSAGSRTEGSRADLTEKFAALVSHFEPPFFVMENVARAQYSGAYGRALDQLKNAGYAVEKLVIDSSLCGVPQRRKRLIAFGSMDASVSLEVKERLNEGLGDRRISVRDWFGERLNTETYYRHPRSYARRGVFSIDEPSPTIRGVNRPIPKTYALHKGDAGSIEQSRALSAQERAELQTFPPGFKFKGSNTEIEQMIGNAVPVRLAKYVASAIADVLNGR